jgi:hypothetical protein
MRIYVDNNSVFLTSSSKLDTLVTMAAGSHNVVVQAWDSSGAVFKSAETITATVPTTATINVTSPVNNASVTSPFQVVASASGPNPITTMQVYLDNLLVTSVQGATLNVPVTAAGGMHSLVVQAWDSTGAAYKDFETITVKTSSGTVNVSSPANNATVTSPFTVAASATGPNPITAMQVYLDNTLDFSVSAASLKTSLSAGAGSHLLVVQAWDTTGAVYKQSLTVTVSSSVSPVPSNAITKSEIQNMTGWQSCTVCAGIGGNGPVATFSMTQFQASPSLSGSSAKFTIGGVDYGDALWWKQLGADNSATNFRYDLDFYLTAPQLSQALEFDVNQSNGVMKFIFGSQCNIKGGGVWDVWDTAGGVWRSTGIACSTPAAFTWHHLTWELLRNSTQTTFVALTLDGVRHYVNMTFNAKPESANEVNVAFQMDLNSAGQTYSAWLDNVTLSYW